MTSEQRSVIGVQTALEEVKVEREMERVKELLSAKRTSSQVNSELAMRKVDREREDEGRGLEHLDQWGNGVEDGWRIQDNVTLCLAQGLGRRGLKAGGNDLEFWGNYATKRSLIYCYRLAYLTYS
jgi:hypothetical protein